MAFFEPTSDFVKLVKISDRKKVALLDYTANDFITARSALIKYIKAVYPLDYNNITESDLGIVLIELVAYMSAVLSMKADMLANENVLRTAKQRESVRKLLQLVGVSMKGPLSAAANAQITLDSTTPDPNYPLTINAADRSITVTSPEDGGTLTFTIYKTVDGYIESPTNAEGNIDLYTSESLDGSGLVFNNLALLEGTLITETGTLNSTNTVKTISLTEGPVIEGSVQVFITTDSIGEAWTRVDNLFSASGSSDKIFQVVYGENYRATVLFGDGITGQTPTQNSTYLVVYRVGGGTRGNIKNEVINAPITLVATGYEFTIPGVLENTSMATGGGDAETVEHAKKWGPLVFKTQNRVVTLEDFDTFVNTYVSPLGEQCKGKAVTRKAFSSANIIDVYVLQKATETQLQKASPDYKRSFIEDIDQYKFPTVDVVVVDGLIRTLDIITTIRVDRALKSKEEEIKQKVKNKIVYYFNTDNVEFGQGLIVADLNREIFTIPEIKYSTIDNLDPIINLEFNELLQLNNLEINVEYV